jgi:putative transposase
VRRLIFLGTGDSLNPERAQTSLAVPLAGGETTLLDASSGTVLLARLEAAGITISMDGRGRALDNVFVERLWRTVKYEEVYLNAYETPREATQGLRRYFEFYNAQRLHQSLAYRTPAAVYFGNRV